MKIKASRWTKAIFKKAGYHSSGQVLYILEKVNENQFIENNLISKNDFIENYIKLVESIEQTGDIMSESREMLGPGSVFEDYFPGQYGSLRSSYITQRKKLEKQLHLIKLLFPVKSNK